MPRGAAGESVRSDGFGCEVTGKELSPSLYVGNRNRSERSRIILMQRVPILMYFKNTRDVVCKAQGLLTLTREGGEAPWVFTGVPAAGPPLAASCSHRPPSSSWMEK